MTISLWDDNIDREPAVAGRFYAGDRETLLKDLAELFRDCTKNASPGKVRAIISPHAGYVFSGKTAAAAFSVINPETEYDNVFIIGSSHVMSFDGASVYASGDFLNPLGRMTVNKKIATKLAETNSIFNFQPSAHAQEHSIEVQIPFIQYHFKNQPELVPIIIGTQKESTIQKIAGVLDQYFTAKNLFIISSDFSHYPPYQEAREADLETARALVSGDPDLFLGTLKENARKNIRGMRTSMCGWSSGLVLLYLAKGKNGLQFNLVDYTNSGDSKYGGKDEVVGYYAISLTENEQDAHLSFTEDEKTLMFDIARTSIKSRFDKRTRPVQDEKIPQNLFIQAGAFVTIKIEGALRGCIGRFTSSEPLYDVIRQSAVSSAFGDPRFNPLTEDEFEKAEIEITVLGPMKRIQDINEIVPGRHGIYIRKDKRCGTMLPQVAIEHKWTREEFLGYTSRDKAGLGWDGWKDAELYIYEGLVLEEKKKSDLS